MNVKFFASATGFRAWLDAHQDTAAELWVGFHRKDSGRGGLTYPEALDEALCCGWIDGVRKRVDATSYTNRFSPRRARSTWSLVNIRRVGHLKRLGRMTPAGLAAFAARDAKNSGIYSFEQRHAARLDPASARQLRADRAAWAFFQQQPPSYQRTASWWVISAKRPETRARRLRVLIKCCTRGQRVPPLAASKNP